MPPGGVGGAGPKVTGARRRDTEIPHLLVDLLGHLADGSIAVDIDAVPFASIDARAHDVEVQLGPIVGARRATRSSVDRGEGAAELWRARRIPSELARNGWRVRLWDGGEELVALGRGTNPLTGHVHATPAALWKLRKLV